MDGIEKEVRIYQSPEGRMPYLDWWNRLKDQRAQDRINARIARVRLGNMGQTRGVGDGVQELKIDYGPGYRVYFGQHGDQLVILLCGGDKGTQNADIKKAKTYWADFRRRQAGRSER